MKVIQLFSYKKNYDHAFELLSNNIFDTNLNSCRKIVFPYFLNFYTDLILI